MYKQITLTEAEIQDTLDHCDANCAVDLPQRRAGERESHMRQRAIVADMLTRCRANGGVLVMA